MDIIQARLPEGMIKSVDRIVKEKHYSSRSDFIKDAIRKSIEEHGFRKLIGSVPNTGDSVKEVREVRKRLSEELKTKEGLEKIKRKFRHMITD